LKSKMTARSMVHEYRKDSFVSSKYALEKNS
jgi:hypothetical protein